MVGTWEYKQLSSAADKSTACLCVFRHCLKERGLLSFIMTSRDTIYTDKAGLLTSGKIPFGRDNALRWLF